MIAMTKADLQFDFLNSVNQSNNNFENMGEGKRLTVAFSKNKKKKITGKSNKKYSKKFCYWCTWN